MKMQGIPNSTARALEAAVAFEIRKARESDRPEIIGLIRDVFGDEVADRADARWAWQWHQDPKLEGSGYQGMVAVWEGQLIASMATIPSGLFVDGQLLPDAVWFADALAHWSRVRKALRSLRKAGSEDAGVDLSSGLVGAILNHPECPPHHLGKHLTDPMLVVAYKVGTVDQPGTGSWARMVSLKALLARHVGRPLGWLLGTIADLFLPAIPGSSRPVETLKGPFDARFDRLFEDALVHHHAITRRDAAVLNWRYRQNPDTDYDVLTLSEGKVLKGYLVMGRFERHGQPRAHVLDLLAEKDDPSVLKSLLSECLRRLRDEGVTRLECYTGSTAVQEVLEALGFRQRLHRGQAMPTVVRRIDVPELYVTRGDGDGG
jgi:hypothetical protein